MCVVKSFILTFIKNLYLNDTLKIFNKAINNSNTNYDEKFSKIYNEILQCNHEIESICSIMDGFIQLSIKIKLKCYHLRDKEREGK